MQIEFEEWLNEWLEKGNDYIQPLSLLIEELRQSKKVLCLNLAENNVYNANDIYENWDLQQVYEWQAIKLATNYQNKEKK